jgi:hypothetical protein
MVLAAGGKMPSASEPKKRVRPLYAWEVEQARVVFGDQLRYDQIRIHEGVGWPDAIDACQRPAATITTRSR